MPASGYTKRPLVHDPAPQHRLRHTVLEAALEGAPGPSPIARRSCRSHALQTAQRAAQCDFAPHQPAHIRPAQTVPEIQAVPAFHRPAIQKRLEGFAGRQAFAHQSASPLFPKGAPRIPRRHMPLQLRATASRPVPAYPFKLPFETN